MHVRGYVEPMLARAVDRMPSPAGHRGGLRYEPKMDGFRCLASVNDDRGVELLSRRGRRMNEAFPEIVSVVFDALPAGTVVDGELVRWSPDGRLDFAALQHRHNAGRRARQLAAAEPVHYVLYDVLEAAGEDLRRRPLTERRTRLEQLLAPVEQPSLLTLGMQTDDPEVAQIWFDQLHQVGIEGIVAKPAAGLYRAGERGWMKYKHRSDAAVIVGGITGTRERPEALLLGRYDADGGVLQVVGRTARIPDDAAAELAPLLHSPAGPHPWPAELPASWTGTRYGNTDPITYHQVEPDLVVEVDVDVAAQHGAWRHAVRWRRARPDLAVDDVPRGL